MADKSEARIADKSEASTIRSGERALQEVNQDRAGFVQEQKRQMQDAQAGGRSTGITREFGKVEVVESGKTLTKGTEREGYTLVDRADVRKTAQWFEERLNKECLPGDMYLKKLQNIPKAELSAVSEAYYDITGRKLDADLKNELDQAKNLKDTESERKLTQALEVLQGATAHESTAAKPAEKPAATHESPATKSADKAAAAPADAGHGGAAGQAGTERLTQTFPDKSRIVSVGGQITEVVATDGHTRKFHYDANGKVDQIDGRLGHWDRAVGKDGAVTWKNKDTGIEWKGEFTVDADGNLQFRREGGSTFIFGRNGETTRVPVENPNEKTEAAHYAEWGQPSQSDKVQKSSKVDADGTVHYEYKDGTKEVHAASGEIRVDYPDKSGWKQTRDGTKHVWNSNGDVQVDYPDKSGFKQTANGERSVWHSNGDEDFYSAGKLVSQWHKESDGSEIRKDGEGRITTVIAPDGENRRDVFYDESGEPKAIQGYLGSWAREVDSHGKVYWQNQQDPKVQWHGTLEVDKEGQLHYTPHDSKAQSWVFTRDGRDLPVARGRK